MSSRSGPVAFATLAVALITLAIAVALLIRPVPTAPAVGTGGDAGGGSGVAVASLEAEVSALRDEIAELRDAIEESSGGGAEPVDLEPIAERLDRLEASMAAVTVTVNAMNATATTICQLVADSPLTPAVAC